MKKFITPFTFLLAIAVFVSCDEAKKTTDKEEAATEEKEVAIIEDKVLTKEERDILTPDMIIRDFKDGNDKYMKSEMTPRNHSEQIKKSTGGQSPKAIVLSCIDSRVPVENVFDEGIGDIFVARVAGNFSNEDILGSMEYACKVAASR